MATYRVGHHDFGSFLEYQIEQIGTEAGRRMPGVFVKDQAKIEKLSLALAKIKESVEKDCKKIFLR